MLELMRSRSAAAAAPNQDDHDLDLAHLTVLRRREVAALAATSCLESAPDVPRSPSTHRSSSCAYHGGLKWQLLDSIDGFYLEALARLLSEFVHKHLRGILVGGHCIGPLDTADVLDMSSFHRMERRSLAGLIMLYASFFCDSVDWVVVEPKALEYLCSTKCDISSELRRALEICSPETRTRHFSCAARDAEHPQRSGLGRFHGSLYPQAVDDCMRLLRCGQGFKSGISSQEVEQLYGLIRTFTCEGVSGLPTVSTLLPQAQMDLAEKKNFRAKQSFVRKSVDIMLHEYNSSHTEEPKYKLHAICGVTTSVICYGLTLYHANFLARTDCSSNGCVLFFSEFFGFCTFNKVDQTMAFVHDMGRSFFCCPISISCDFEARLFIQPPGNTSQAMARIRCIRFLRTTIRKNILKLICRSNRISFTSITKEIAIWLSI